jgi:pimeloyl-ACP methyl ester carboxylesterase
MIMLAVYALSNRTVSVYTSDHRGTGRSARLDCIAAQAFADGSPGGGTLMLEEFPSCIADALNEIDYHTEAFSVTSAAHDVDLLVNALHDEDEQVFLYGASYGTYLVERVLHLQPKLIKGYILDGVVSEGGPDENSRLFFSNWNDNIYAPSRRFFELCALQQEQCPLKLDAETSSSKNQDGVIPALLAIYDEIDATDNDCAYGFANLVGSDGPPSLALRSFLGLVVRDPTFRVLIPSIIMRVQRCTQDDFYELALVMQPLVDYVAEQYSATSVPSRPMGSVSASIAKLASYIHRSDGEDTDHQYSYSPSAKKFTSLYFDGDGGAQSSQDTLLYLLIAMSELWSVPSPSEEELAQSYLDGAFSQDLTDVVYYCLLSGSLNVSASDTSDPACSSIYEEFEDMMMEDIVRDTPVFKYDADEFTNKTASIPANTSVLVITGGLDFQTPSEFGKYQFDHMKLEDEASSQKMHLHFDFGVHVTGMLPTTVDDDTYCGPRIVTDFVLMGGDASRVDTSCVGELPQLELSDDLFKMVVEGMLASGDDGGDVMYGDSIVIGESGTSSSANDDN